MFSLASNTWIHAQWKIFTQFRKSRKFPMTFLKPSSPSHIPDSSLEIKLGLVRCVSSKTCFQTYVCVCECACESVCVCVTEEVSMGGGMMPNQAWVHYPICWHWLVVKKMQSLLQVPSEEFWGASAQKHPDSLLGFREMSLFIGCAGSSLLGGLSSSCSGWGLLFVLAHRL